MSKSNNVDHSLARQSRKIDESHNRARRRPVTAFVIIFQYIYSTYAHNNQSGTIARRLPIVKSVFVQNGNNL